MADLSEKTAKLRPTTERLLDAATEVFSREGLSATTREIARVAEVNEATLFRQFASKEKLLAEVTRRIVAENVEVLNRLDLANFDLRRDLLRMALTYDRTNSENMGFFRAMMGQPADPKLAEQIIKEIVEPLRAKFRSYLAEGQRRGLVRDTDLVPAVDIFTGMIFAGSLRRSIFRSGYSREHYLQTCVDLFLHGIST